MVHNSRGFTLIEALIYIALLGLIMTGAVATSYQLAESEASLASDHRVQEEGNFVINKLQWALSGAQTVSAPTAWGSALSLTRYDGISVDVRLTGGAVEIRENGGSYAVLTTSNVTVSDLSFHYLPASGNTPAGVEASTTIDGVSFYLKRYLRQ
jgi:type II secretory pathway pseudopilin PulG